MHTVTRGTAFDPAVNRAALLARWGKSPAAAASADARLRPGSREVAEIRSASGAWIPLQAGDDAAADATRWLDGALAGRAVPSAVVVLGAGVGHIVERLAERAPAARILVLEPEPALAELFLTRRDWRPLIEAGRLLVLVGPAFDGASQAWRVLDGEDDPLILVHPVLVRERREVAMAAARVIGRAKTDWTSNREARRQLGAIYIRHTLANVPRFHRWGDVASLFGLFPGVPAILLAAGPSLNRNLDELRAWGDVKSRALLISVDTALRPCLAAGIVPDLTVAVDASDANGRHLSRLPDTGGTRLVAEGSVAPAAFDAFGDRVSLLRVANHAPWPLLRSLGVDRGVLTVWGSVLTAAADLALRLGCDPIVYAGADLAYTNGQPYCWGTVYDADWAYGQQQGYVLEDLWRTHWLKEPAVHLPDVHGAETRTATHLVAFRDWLVDLSMTRTDRRFVNASQAGILHGGAIVQERLGGLLDGLADAAPDRGRLAQAAVARSDDAHLVERLLLRGPSALRAAAGEGDPVVDAAAMTATLAEGFERSEHLRHERPRLPEEPLLRRVQQVIASCAAHVAAPSPASRHAYRDLAAEFRALLVPDLHPGMAAGMFDQLRALCWTTRANAADVDAFTADVVEPMRSHARAWAERLAWAPRTTANLSPVHVAYLGYNTELAGGHPMARAVSRLLEGHRTLGSPRFRVSYLAWRPTDDAMREALAATGTPLREVAWSAGPCASLARLCGEIAEAGIDVLVTDQALGVPAVLFEARVAPVQARLESAFHAWAPGLADAVLPVPGPDDDPKAIAEVVEAEIARLLAVRAAS